MLLIQTFINPNLRRRSRDSNVLRSGGNVTSCLKLVRIMLETLNLIRKHCISTHM